MGRRVRHIHARKNEHIRVHRGSGARGGGTSRGIVVMIFWAIVIIAVLRGC